MSLILNIDTAVQSASVCLAAGNAIININNNPSQKTHATWLHLAISDVLKLSSVSIHELNAVAVSAGPGSYTGLRVVIAAAKGLCYALKIPLITVDTLKMMALSARIVNTGLLCPMIDARRMEVFTALYTQQLQIIAHPANMILDKNSYAEFLSENEICFFGNGSNKFQNLTNHVHAKFATIETTAAHMIPLSYELFSLGKFTNLAYVEPTYIKDFYSTSKLSN